MDEKHIELEQHIATLEARMQAPDFWIDKHDAQEVIREYQKLKARAEGVDAYDVGDAVLTIFSGAGGDDAEDFAQMLLGMYRKYTEGKGWGMRVLHEHTNEHGGIKNITCEIAGKQAYGTLKNESGVHRLVRISPFNAKKLRHTSFAMVEVVPRFEKQGDIELDESELQVEFAKSSGPGGQNVNKRETAVRVVHIPTGISAHVSSERSQVQNREKALAILRGKLYHIREKERRDEEAGLAVSKSTLAEWGNQIRSYVLHPYKMVKDHRTNVESRLVEDVLNGDLDMFIEAENSTPPT